jgi:hypothetical protein
MFRTNDDFSLFEPISKPIYCENTRGSVVRNGSIIVYREHYEGGSHGHRLGRVLGRVTRHANGEAPHAPSLAVLALSDDMSFAYMRHVSVTDVMEVRSQEGFGATLLFVLFGETPDPDETRRACSYGAMSDNYITEYLRGDTLVFNEVREQERAAAPFSVEMRPEEQAKIDRFVAREMTTQQKKGSRP